MSRRKIAGVNVDFDLTYQTVLSHIDDYVKLNKPNFIWTINPEFVMKAQKDLEFLSVLNMASLATPDGIGLIFADKYLKEIQKLKVASFFPIKALFLGLKIGLVSFFQSNLEQGRITGSDLIYKLAEHCEEKGYTVFLLGGWEKDFMGKLKPHHGDIAGKAALKLKELYPKLNIIGATSEYDYQERYDVPAMDYIHQCMKKALVDSIDMFLVGYGSKKQEEWLVRNINNIPAKVGIGVGAAFDFVSSSNKRAPNIFKDKNIEWIYRLIVQPWRIKRILISFPVFPLFVFYLSLKEHFKQN